jgi:4-diphosphocytidyl-2-C-methyl-D-erythritol kinase
LDRYHQDDNLIRLARVPAYGKLNLGLRVLYKRPDGFHELRTVFQTISLADRLEIAWVPGRITRVEIEGTPEIADNLVGRAARLVLEALKVHGDARFKLKKNIPMGAGLGGGSSDAAAVLLALPVLIGKPLSADRLLALASRLGSDVPFFLHGGTALGLGRGEELYPLPDYPASNGILITPDIHSSTADAYNDLSMRLTSISLQNKINSFQQQVWRGGSEGQIAVDDNDFEEVVFARYPELKHIKQRLRRAGAEPVAMTGSGSAIFGIFADEEKADRAKKSFPDKTVFPISFVSRAKYRSAWRRALHLHAEGTLWPPRSLHNRNPYAQ